MRILYLHGMGGPTEGSHSRAVMLPFLRSLGVVFAPNLHTDDRFLVPFRREALIRHALRQPGAWAAIAVGAAGGLTARAAAASAGIASLVGVVLSAAVLRMRMRSILQRAIDDAVSSTLATAERALSHARATLGGVDVLVGQSWGGAVAALLVARGLYDGPTLLTAPATALMMGSPASRHHGRAVLPAGFDAGCMACVSGAEDGVVDPCGVDRWATEQGVRFVLVPGGMHNLAVGAGADGEKAVLAAEIAALVARAPAQALSARGCRSTWGADDEWLTPSAAYNIGRHH